MINNSNCLLELFQSDLMDELILYFREALDRKQGNVYRQRRRGASTWWSEFSNSLHFENDVNINNNDFLNSEVMIFYRAYPFAATEKAVLFIQLWSNFWMEWDNVLNLTLTGTRFPAEKFLLCNMEIGNSSLSPKSSGYT